MELEDPDAELVRRAQAELPRRTAAYSEIVRRHSGQVFRRHESEAPGFLQDPPQRTRALFTDAGLSDFPVRSEMVSMSLVRIAWTC